MAENTYTTLEKEAITVTDRGITLDIPKPEWLPSSEEYEDSAKLEEWARKSGHMHAVLQAGIRQEIISLRAAIRPTGSKQAFEEDECTERSLGYAPSVQARPRASKTPLSPEQAIAQLLSEGKSPEDIMALIQAQTAS